MERLGVSRETQASMAAGALVQQLREARLWVVGTGFVRTSFGDLTARTGLCRVILAVGLSRINPWKVVSGGCALGKS